MTRMAILGGGAIAAMLAATPLLACGDGAPPVQTGAQSAAVHSVLASPQGAGFAGQFSRTPRALACAIRGGGPAPGIRVPGRCSTAVVLRGDGSALVRFVETWDGRRFRGPGSAARPGLRHGWLFTVSPTGGVRAPRSWGDVPPQLVK